MDEALSVAEFLGDALLKLAELGGITVLALLAFLLVWRAANPRRSQYDELYEHRDWDNRDAYDEDQYVDRRRMDRFDEAER